MLASYERPDEQLRDLSYQVNIKTRPAAPLQCLVICPAPRWVRYEVPFITSDAAGLHASPYPLFKNSPALSLHVREVRRQNRRRNQRQTLRMSQRVPYHTRTVSIRSLRHTRLTPPAHRLPSPLSAPHKPDPAPDVPHPPRPPQRPRRPPRPRASDLFHQPPPRP